MGPVILSVSPPSKKQATPNQGVFQRDRIPSLRDDALEPENTKLLPVTMAFERALGRAWRAKDASIPPGLNTSLSASITSAADHNAQRQTSISSASDVDKPLSLRSLLRELAKKYDQYDGFRQQDAHELLRHLLDSMSMEEKDLIKVFQPPPPPKVDGEGKVARRSRSDSDTQQVDAPVDGIKEEDRMIPFTDALFSGSLVSAVICEGCKTVSRLEIPTAVRKRRYLIKSQT
jgi:ubiquitin carboxyl-terminal hydrolase 16/45